MSRHAPKPNDALDADIVAALSGAQAPAEGDAAALRHVRDALMHRIAQEATTRHLTVRPDCGEWRDFLPGIRRKVLHQQAGVMSYLLKFEAGAVLPAHRHPMDEECVVLEGRLRIGDIELAAGGFHLARQDLPHGEIVSEPGCTIFLRGAVPQAGQLL